MKRNIGLVFFAAAALTSACVIDAGDDRETEEQGGTGMGGLGSGGEGSTGGGGTGSGSGSGTGSGSGSGSETEPEMSKPFTAAVDGGSAQEWELLEGHFGPTGQTYPATSTWIRARNGNQMIDLMFGPGAPAVGTYTCHKPLLPSTAPSSALFWQGTTAYSSQCSPSQQSHSCTYTISEAHGETGRVRGSYEVAVGCPTIVHRIRGTFDVTLPFNAP